MMMDFWNYRIELQYIQLEPDSEFVTANHSVQT